MERADDQAPAKTFRAHVLTPRDDGGWDDWADGRLEIRDGRVARAGSWRARRDDSHVDLRPHIVMPGLVDTHAHVPQLPVCGVHPESLLEWLRKWTFPLERRFTGTRARTLTSCFVREMLAQGTTTAGLYTSAWPDSVEACFEAAREAGVHAWIGPPLMDDGAYRRVTTKRVLDEARALSRLDSPMLRFAVTPRFALSCTRELLAGCGELARERQLPVQTHLAEQLPECAAVRERFGREYLDVYDDAGLLTPRTIFAHAIWLSARDWRRVARRGCAVAHCPTSNVFLGSGVMNWERARTARLGLGSDVGAGPDLSIFRVARMAWTVHSMRRSPAGARSAGSSASFYRAGDGASGPAPGNPADPSDLLFAATRGGALALGFDDVGALRPGFSADFIVLDAGQVVPPGAPGAESTRDLLSRILHRAGRSSIRQTYVGGVPRHEGA